MSSSQYYFKLVLSLACLGTSIFVVVEGQSLINQQKASQAQAGNNSPQEQSQSDSPQAQHDAKTTQLLAQVERNATEVNTLQKDLDDKRSEIGKEMQEKQAKIAAANQYSQVLYHFAQVIVAASTDSNGGVKDAKLRELLTRDGITVNAQPPAPNLPAALPASPGLSAPPTF